MNKIAKLIGALRRNPNSKSAKARESKRKLITGGVASCCKCGASKATLYKRLIGGKERYICKQCYSETPEYAAEMQRKRSFIKGGV